MHGYHDEILERDVPIFFYLFSSLSFLVSEQLSFIYVHSFVCRQSLTMHVPTTLGRLVLGAGLCAARVSVSQNGK
jgi:hypothetical protein